MTRIPVMTPARRGVFSLFNDPDTGIRLPGQTNHREGPTHVTIATILRQLRVGGTRCVITFDQSHYRLPDMPRDEQYRVKMRALSEGGSFSFYYVLHAPFLFAFPSRSSMKQAQTLIHQAGIPIERFRTI